MTKMMTIKRNNVPLLKPLERVNFVEESGGYRLLLLVLFIDPKSCIDYHY